MNTLHSNSATSSVNLSMTKTKSAFTPINIQKPIALKQSPLNLFEPSPMQKLLYNIAMAQQHSDVAAQAFKKVFTPTKVMTPSQFLNLGQ